MSEADSVNSTVPQTRTRALGWHCWLCAALLAVAGFFADTHDNSFPFYYHVDEPSKTGQVIRGEYNFHHPLLLLDATEGLMRIAGTPKEPQAVVEKGRTASAIFAALSIAAMVVLGWQLGGAAAGWLAGVLTLTHPALFELSHYMKEDCALLVGLTWTAVALVAYGRKRTLAWAILVGLAAGLTASGKLLGLVMTGTALLAVSLTRRPMGSRWTALLASTLAAAVCFAAWNAPAFSNLQRVSTSLGKEIEKIEKRGAEKEERDEGIKFKHLSKLGTTLSVPLLLGLAYWSYRRWRERGPVALRVLGCFVVGYFLIVSLSPKTKDRYLLPVYVLACGLGAAGMVEWTRAQPAGSRWRWAGPVLAAAAVVWHLPELAENWNAFGHDDRRDLTAWLREHVPTKEGIAHDIRAHLSLAQEFRLPGFELPNPLLAPEDRRMAELGTLAQLRARGITYVVACDADYHSVLQRGGKADQREFYQKLFDKNKLLWERPPGPIAYLQPGLRVYELK